MLQYITYCMTLLGDVPMDVVCFVWDQCFLGLGIAEYQYIPYLIATLLLIMREPLLLCKEVSLIIIYEVGCIFIIKITDSLYYQG